MASLNKVILIGHIAHDLELKTTQSGVSVCSFSIGVNRKYSKDGEQKSDFINIVAWRQQAEFLAKFFKKGNAVCIVGSLQVRQWTDNNGNKRYSTEVIADEVSFVEKKESSTAADDLGYSVAPKFEEISADDDLPFD